MDPSLPDGGGRRLCPHPWSPRHGSIQEAVHLPQDRLRQAPPGTPCAASAGHLCLHTGRDRCGGAGLGHRWGRARRVAVAEVGSGSGRRDVRGRIRLDGRQVRSSGGVRALCNFLDHRLLVLIPER